MRTLLPKFSAHYSELAEAKLDERFRNSQFATDQYELQSWLDKKKNGGN